MRKAGDVCFAEVSRDSEGRTLFVVEYNYEYVFFFFLHEFYWHGSVILTKNLNAGTFGLVDYTNYEDMKYAVSCGNTCFDIHAIFLIHVFSSIQQLTFSCVVR